jgi:hypothetical protein
MVGSRGLIARESTASKSRAGETTMAPTSGSEFLQAANVSLMTLSDRLITLAQDAKKAGYPITAEQLARLAMKIFDEAPRRR